MMRRTLILVCLISALWFTAIATPQTSRAQDDCPPPRFNIGDYAQVTPGISNRVRSAPTTSAEIIARIPGRGIFRIIDGPECADGFLWWRVDYEGVIGWTAAGTATEAFIVPLDIVTPPEVTAEVVPEVTEEVTPGPSVVYLPLESGIPFCELPVYTKKNRELKTNGTHSYPCRITSKPDFNAPFAGLLAREEKFTVLAGPRIINRTAWWFVKTDEDTGWIADARDHTPTATATPAILPPVPTTSGSIFFNDPVILEDEFPYSVSWNASGEWLAVGTDRGLYLINARDFSAPAEYIIRDHIVEEVVFNPKNPDQLALKRLRYSETLDDNMHEVYLFDIMTGEYTQEIIETLLPIRDLSFSGDGKTLAYIKDGSPTGVSLETGEIIFDITLRDWSDGLIDYQGVTQMALNYDASLIAMSDGQVHIQPVNGRVRDRRTFDRGIIPPTIEITALELSHDGGEIAIGDAEGNVQVWDVLTSKLLTYRGDKQNAAYAIAFHPRYITDFAVARGSETAQVHILSTVTNTRGDEYMAGPGAKVAGALAFGQKGNFLAVIVDTRLVILETEFYSSVHSWTIQAD